MSEKLWKCVFVFLLVDIHAEIIGLIFQQIWYFFFAVCWFDDSSFLGMSHFFDFEILAAVIDWKGCCCSVVSHVFSAFVVLQLFEELLSSGIRL